MRAHLIENGTVINTIEVESLDFMPNLVEATHGSIGWRYENGEILPPLPDLDALRTAKNDEINAERERRTFDTFEHAGKTISCDTLSRSDIDGVNGYVALNNAFPSIWPGAWKCADNTYLTIATVDEWKAFYGSMVAAGAALYARAQALKAALSKATTADEIAAIHW